MERPKKCAKLILRYLMFDKFHLLSNLGKSVDEVRGGRREFAGATGALKNVIKGQRLNLLRHPENLKEGWEGEPRRPAGDQREPSDGQSAQRPVSDDLDP